jgi:phosphatidate cytidylyltransferase
MFHYDPQRPVVPRVAAGSLTVAYVGVLGSFLVLIRGLGNSEQGMAALLSVVVVTKMSDSGAYFVGKSIGRHKLAPKLSPGKTIEGLLGGILFGCLASVLFFEAVGGRWNCQPTLGVCLIYGLVLSLVGVVGDLAESLLKRHAGCKDSSRWLPGLGGVLDIMDSLLFTFVVGYLFWVAGLMGN